MTRDIPCYLRYLKDADGVAIDVKKFLNDFIVL